MEPYFQEMDFNAGHTGKQAVRMYTTPALQRSGGLISTQLAGYHGAEENDIMGKLRSSVLFIIYTINADSNTYHMFILF